MSSRATKTIINVAGAALAATAAAAAANAVIARNRRPLKPAVPGRHRTYAWDGGRVAYTESGAGRPLVLLHSHNAAASSYEMRRAFREFEVDHHVYAPDLPGYGMSERRDRPYLAQTYIRFIHDFLEEVVGEPAAVIASSVTAAQAMAGAAEDDTLFKALIAVSPTGLSQTKADAPPGSRILGAIFSVPVWGQALFNAITSRRGLRSFETKHVFYNPWNVTHAMIDYAWDTSHQPNAIYAPDSFLAGALWADARATYHEVACPLLAVWGDHDTINPYGDSAPLLGSNPRAQVSIITQSGATPHDEQPAEFAKVVRQFLQGI